MSFQCHLQENDEKGARKREKVSHIVHLPLQMSTYSAAIVTENGMNECRFLVFNCAKSVANIAK